MKYDIVTKNVISFTVKHKFPNKTQAPNILKIVDLHKRFRSGQKIRYPLDLNHRGRGVYKHMVHALSNAMYMSFCAVWQAIPCDGSHDIINGLLHYLSHITYLLISDAS